MGLRFHNFRGATDFLAVDCFHVPLLVVDTGEVFGADRTLKRLLARVSSHVGGQLLLGEKGFRTLRAFVGEDI